MADQEDTRLRLIDAATRVFAEFGFHAATTREISRRANVNLAAIHYHFGDKASLYQEVFRQPFLHENNEFAQIDEQVLPLEEVLKCFFRWICPPSDDENAVLQMTRRLHAREEVEPSGILGDVLAHAFRPNHDKLRRVLCREMGLSSPDIDVDRLAFSIVGMASIYFHGRCVVEELSPELLHGDHVKSAAVDRLATYAAALIECERKRRSAERSKVSPGKQDS
jgi:AcrR family transcriptional regulator